jgi:hypothetical protein
MEVVEKISMIEWMANNYKTFGCALEIITDRSQEGSQFCSGFGGIGGILRYRVDFAAMDNEDLVFDDVDLDDYMCKWRAVFWVLVFFLGLIFRRWVQKRLPVVFVGCICIFASRVL